MNAKKLCASLAVLGLVLLGGGASFAEIGTIDAVPAATLLLPYFEVDLDDASGVTTLFSVNNASAAPTVAHVTIWSDLTIPVLDFNIYLTGYDVQTLNMRDVLNGILPGTADEDSDPTDVISPTDTGLGIPLPLVPGQNGGNWDDSFAGCVQGATLTVPPDLIDRMQDGLTGQPVAFDGGLCLGTDQGDRIARGYITVDNVTECTVAFPGEAGYFGTGVPSSVNQLWGDFFIVDDGNDFAIGDNLVHIEADAGLNNMDGQTFYGRYVDFTGADEREALGNQFGVRYLTNAAFTGGTDLLVWREGSPFLQPADSAPFVCGGAGPSWFADGLNEAAVVAFNETEQWEELCVTTTEESPISPPPPPTADALCFPLEAQRVAVGSGQVVPSFQSGWLFLDLQDDEHVNENQAWVVAEMSANNRFSVGFSAIQLNNVTGDPGVTPPVQ